MTFRLAAVYPDLRFVFDGQSLNNQPSGTPQLTLPYVSTFGLGPVGNVSIGGASWTALTTGTGLGGASFSAAQRLHPVFRHSANVVLTLVGGTSDLLFEDDDAATVLSDMVAYSDAARAAAATYSTDIYVIGCTIPATFNMTTDQNDDRLEFNDLLIADAGSDFDAVVDLTEDELGPLADPDDTTYYFDGVHWNATGAAYASTLVRPALITGAAALS